MKRFALALGLAAATASVVLVLPAALAQPAAAIGRPLPDSTLPLGTVSVRVVAGAPSTPVIGTEVTLLVNGQPRVARTDSAGRAAFPGLPAGATVQAKALDAEGKETGSEAFPVPGAGGVRLMLTTKPFTGTAGMAPAAPGAPAGGPPEARSMSGQPRADRAVAPASYLIRLTYNNLEVKDGKASDPEPPVGESVTLVGYSYDNTVVVHTAKLDKEGYAKFDGLDVSGGIVYFALARLPRNGSFDRLASVPVQLETQAGAKLILSGDKRTAGSPPIDDLAGPQASPPTPGKVRVTLDGYPTELSEIVLVDAATKAVVAKGKPTIAPPDPSKVEGSAELEPAADLPPGTLDIQVHGGASGSDVALPDVMIRVVPARATNVAEGITSKTDASGRLRLAVKPDEPHKVLFTVNGKELASGDLDLSKSGGRLDLFARWEAEGRPEVVFDVPANPGHVLYAETRQLSPLSKQVELFRSMPFQTVETAGAHVSISVLPRILFRFTLQSFVEDEILAVRGLWRIDNNSWIPYRDTPDGLLIKLPRGHVGGVIGDEFQHDVSLAQGEGYRIVRPLAPGPKQFEAGFSLITDEGRATWHLDLPLGAFQSSLQIRQFPGMQVNLPPGVKGEVQTFRSGTPWFVIDDIMIPTKQSMVLTITGLPSHPKWKKWVPRIVGLTVIAVMLGGLGFALTRKRDPKGGHTARRTALMNELVELEKTGGDPKRREAVLAELEQLWE